MGANKWTESQQNAIDKKEGNILVAAAAGSGKTAVLVERIIKKIMQGTDIDRLLIVTFTNSAAAEMRERINKAITEKLIESPDNKHLKRQMLLINKSNIMTTDAFCLGVVKEHFYELKIDPKINIADSSEINIIKQEVIEEILEELIEKGNLFIEKYSEVYNKTGEDLENAIEVIYSYIQSFPYPLEWLEEQINKYNIDENNLKMQDIEWGRKIIEYIKDELEIALDNLNQCQEIINESDLDKYQECILSDKSQIEYALSNLSDYDKLYQAINCISFCKIAVIRDKDTDYPEYKEKIKDLRDSVKATINKGLKNIICDNEKNTIEAIKKIYNEAKALYDVVVMYDRVFKEKKRSRNILDFSDIEHHCLNLLTSVSKEGIKKKTKLAAEYMNKFDEIYMDEYQDSNYLQEYILTSISKEDMGEPNVFMVGDIKQSIYAFRQARPELFLDKYDAYSDDITQKYTKILLSKNFRSRENVLLSTNYIFKNLMKKEVGGIDYDEKEELKKGADYKEYENQDYSTEVHIIYKEEKNDDEASDDSESSETSLANNNDIEDFVKQEIEAMYAADIIKNLMGNGTEERYKVANRDGLFRDIEYKDIVILMRSYKSNTASYLKVFRKANIPIFAEAKDLLNEEEIELILSVLSIIDNPYQDIPLASVMYSPIYSFTLDELTRIRLVDKRASYYDCLLKVTTSCDDEVLLNKVENFMSTLSDFREMSRAMTAKNLLLNIYEKTGLRYYLSIMQNGKQKVANFDVLVELAAKYEKTSYKGLFNFINYVQKTKQSDGGDMASACIIGENENTVRLMSIHKSKGLEFPVVLLADSSKPFSFRDANQKIIKHHKLGIGLNVFDLDKRITYPTISTLCIKNQIKQENIAEELRILYVAMTRAKEKLIILGTVPNIKYIDKCDIGISNIEYRHIKGRSNNKYTYLSMILMCLFKHRDVAQSLNGNIEHTNLDKSNWKIKMVKSSDISSSNIENIESGNALSNWSEYINENVNKISDKVKEDINSNLNFEYKYKGMLEIPNKLSISLIKEIKNIDASEGDIENNKEAPIWDKVCEENNEKGQGRSKIVPDFIKTMRISDNDDYKIVGSEYGTLMHYIMQQLKFGNIENYSDILNQIYEIYNEKKITKTEYLCIKEDKNIDKVLKFVQSDIGKLASDQEKKGNVYKEIPFVLNEYVKNIYADKEGIDPSAKILLQGVIDLYIVDNDNQVILIDFKTDKNVDKELIIDKYRIQLYYYKKAIEESLNLKVKQTNIYMFDTGEFIEIK